jgi:hypothetical protein
MIQDWVISMRIQEVIKLGFIEKDGTYSIKGCSVTKRQIETWDNTEWSKFMETAKKYVYWVK